MNGVTWFRSVSNVATWSQWTVRTSSGITMDFVLNGAMAVAHNKNRRTAQYYSCSSQTLTPSTANRTCCGRSHPQTPTTGQQTKPHLEDDEYALHVPKQCRARGEIPKSKSTSPSLLSRWVGKERLPSTHTFRYG